MISHASPEFWKCYRALPQKTQEQTKKAYKQFIQNPFHKSLRFKQVHPKKPIWSVRIGAHYRGLGVKVKANVIVWYWVGSHETYNQLIKRL